jgi:hypothetical protein
VETVVPAGYSGSDPILVELNTDSQVSCVWDLFGLIECTANEGDVSGLSWTIVEVANSPTQASPSPTGGVEAATGTPGITLPPTDTVTGGPGTTAGDGWRLVLLALAGLIGAALLLTPSRVVVRTDDRRR